MIHDWVIKLWRDYFSMYSVTAGYLFMSLSVFRSLSEPLMTYSLHRDLMCAASKTSSLRDTKLVMMFIVLLKYWRKTREVQTMFGGTRSTPCRIDQSCNYSHCAAISQRVNLASCAKSLQKTAEMWLLCLFIQNTADMGSLIESASFCQDGTARQLVASVYWYSKPHYSANPADIYPHRFL